MNKALAIALARGLFTGWRVNRAPFGGVWMWRWHCSVCECVSDWTRREAQARFQGIYHVAHRHDAEDGALTIEGQPQRVALNTSRGFTLIETLAVSALVSLLAGLLLPTLAQVRDRGRQAVCLSNLKQLVAAFHIYADDADGQLPGSGDYSEASMSGWVWCQSEQHISPEWGSLFPYVRSGGVYRCPSDYQNSALSFSMNHELGWRAAGVPSPSETVLLIEERGSGPANMGLNDGVWFPEREADRLTDRHGGGGNFAFVDGHTKWAHQTRRWDGRLFLGEEP